MDQIPNEPPDVSTDQIRQRGSVPRQPPVFLSPDLQEFCARLGILEYLAVAVDLARKCFPLVGEPCVHPEQDPETGEEWLILDIRVRGEIDEVLDSYDLYTDLWISSVPWPEGEKIRLSYHIW
jgi:hypothetical protein